MCMNQSFLVNAPLLLIVLLLSHPASVSSGWKKPTRITSTTRLSPRLSVSLFLPLTRSPLLYLFFSALAQYVSILMMNLSN